MDRFSFRIEAGLLGYVGRSSLKWDIGGEGGKSDWDGIYIAPDADQATGYVEADAKTQRGHGSLWRVTSPQRIDAVLVKGDPNDGPGIDLAVKSACTGGLFVLEQLGSQKLAYIGPAPEGAFELAISRMFFKQCGIKAERVAEAEFRGIDRPDWGRSFPDAEWLRQAKAVV